MNTLLLAAAVLATSLAGQVQAEAFTGNKLKELCRYLDSAKDSYEMIQTAGCAMYVAGAMEGMIYQSIASSFDNGTYAESICVPDNATREQIAAVV